MYLVLKFVLIAVAMHATSTDDSPSVTVERLSDHVWLHTSAYVYPNGARYPSNGLIVKDGDELVLIDTAWGELKTVELLHEIERKVGQPVTGAIVTHFHGDRSAGVDTIEARGIMVQAHPMTRKLSIEHGFPVPDHTLDSLVNRGDSVSIGRIEVYFPGPGHAPDNLVVWLPEERILFGGYAIRSAASQSVPDMAHVDVGSWVVALRSIADRYGTARLVIPGHGKPAGPELVDHTLQLLAEMNGLDD